MSTISQWILHSTCTQTPVHGYTPIHFIIISLASQQCRNVKLIIVLSIYIFHKMVTMKLSNIIHLGFSSCLNLVSCKIFMFHFRLWTVYSAHSNEHSHSRQNIRRHILSINPTASMWFFIFQPSILYSYTIQNERAHSILCGWSVLRSLVQIPE
jgi:hypothetical protein